MPSLPQQRIRIPHFRPRDKILTLKEAAARLGISRHTAFIWAATGKLPARRLGPMFFVRQKDVDTFLSEKAQSKQRRTAAKQVVRDLRSRGS